MAHASEWGRYYWPDGKPAYEVPSADGKKMVEPDIRHAKKLNLKPSVTTIIQEAAKPGLERWKREQVLMAALTLPRLDGEIESAWIKRVFEDSEEQARKAAENGTAIHAAVQTIYGGGVVDASVARFACPAIDTIDGKYGSQLWESEKSFATDDFGGKTDLTKVLGEGHHGYVIDLKTKEFGEDHKKLAWDEHCIQLAAYRNGLSLPKAKCANVFVSVNNPGLVVIHEWNEKELERGWKMFVALKDYWYARTGLARPGA